MKLAIITGVSRGIGQALAHLYLQLGWKVIGLGRNSNLTHANYSWFKCDLKQTDAFSALEIDLSDITEVLLVNNAGILGAVSRLSDQKPEENREVFQVNVLAPMALTKKMAALCGDHIPLTVLNISSGAARRPIASWAYYCASKAALDMFSQCFQLEEHEKGRKTKVYALAPGVIDTDMQAQIRGAGAADFSSLEQFQHYYESGQLQTADEVAAKIHAFLQNPGASEVLCRL